MDGSTSEAGVFGREEWSGGSGGGIWMIGFGDLKVGA